MLAVSPVRAVVLALSLAFTLGCVLASLARLTLVVRLTPIDLGAFAAELQRRGSPEPDRALRSIVHVFSVKSDLVWERDVVQAVLNADDVRSALLGEASTDLDHRAARWVRIPRTSASLASSFGFLLATVSLRFGLSELVGALDGPRELAVNAAVLDAIDVAAVGLGGAAVCVAIQHAARRALALRLAGAERFILLMEAWANGEPLAHEGVRASVSSPSIHGGLLPPIL